MKRRIILEDWTVCTLKVWQQLTILIQVSIDVTENYNKSQISFKWWQNNLYNLTQHKKLLSKDMLMWKCYNNQPISNQTCQK